MTPTAFGLTVRDLVVTGEQGRTLVRVPRFDAAPGALTVLRGPSGAGKSTLLFALAGLHLRVSGTVLWGDADIAAMGPSTAAFRRAHIGMIFQDHLLFDELGMAANAGVAALFTRRRDRAAIRDRAAGALRRLGLPGGERRRAATYSGGERQRIAMARALAHDPPIVLADEPTASLDRPAADRMAEDLAGLARSGRTVVAVSHDPALHAAADALHDMRDGTLTDRLADA